MISKKDLPWISLLFIFIGLQTNFAYCSEYAQFLHDVLGSGIWWLFIKETIASIFVFNPIRIPIIRRLNIHSFKISFFIKFIIISFKNTFGFCSLMIRIRLKVLFVDSPKFCLGFVIIY